MVCYSDFYNLTIRFAYYPKTKTLVLSAVDLITDYDGNKDKTLEEILQENNITQQDIRSYQEYFLYEKLLTDWVTGNKERSLFTVDDFGEFTIIDNTFDNPYWD